MKRKRDIRTRKVKKYKARLNIDGSKMRHGEHYEETYAPVAKWNSIRLILTLSALHGWHTAQLDYVMAFPQAPVQREIYMNVPKGFDIGGEDPKKYVLKILRNVYGAKDAGSTWNKYLIEKLTKECGFKQSNVNECVLYKGSVVYLLYTNDSILAGPNRKEIDDAIADIKRAKLQITEEGNIQDFLGVHISRKEDGTVHLTQLHLIDTILKDLLLDREGTNGRSIPAPLSKLLSRHTNSPDFDNSFNYRSVIGKMNYLEKGSRSDIAYAVHQCARFSSAPKKEHGEAVRWLGQYLRDTRDKGTILRPDDARGLEVYVDADFSGNWDPKETQDKDTARSRHGYLIMYHGCQILAKSQLQMEICLLSTESEYTGLSYALREAIPIMELLKEMREVGLPITKTKATMKCRVFEDNSGALEMARTPKFRP